MGQSQSNSSHQKISVAGSRLSATLRQWPLEQTVCLFQAFRKLELDFGIVKSQFSKWVSSTKLQPQSNVSPTCITLHPRDLANELFETLDSNGNGRVDCLEFLAGIALLSTGNMKDKLKFIFELFDFNANGSLSPFEIALMMKSTVTATEKFLVGVRTDNSKPFSSDITQERIELTTREAFRVYDKDRNEKLSFQEYYAWLGGYKPIVEYLSHLNNESNYQQDSGRAMIRKGSSFQQPELSDGPKLIENIVMQNSYQVRKAMPSSSPASGLEPVCLEETLNRLVPTPPRATLKPEWVFGSPTGSMLLTSDPSNNSKWLATYAVGTIVITLDQESHKQHLYSGHTNPVTAIARCASRNLIASTALATKASSTPVYSEVHIWSLKSHGTLIKTLDTYHNRAICLMEFSDDGILLATVGSGNSGAVKIWSWQSNECLLTIENTRQEQVMAISWATSKKETRLVICYTNHIEIYNLHRDMHMLSNSKSWEQRNRSQSTSSFTYSTITVEASTVATFSTKKHSKLGITNKLSFNGEHSDTLDIPQVEFTTAVSTGECFVVGTAHGSLVLIDMDGVIQHTTHSKSTNRITSLCEWEGGVASGGSDGILRLWDLKLVPVKVFSFSDPSLSNQLSLQQPMISTIASTSAGELVSVGLSDGSFHVTSTVSWETTKIQLGLGKGSIVCNIASHPFLQVVAIAQQNSLSIWDLETHSITCSTPFRTRALSYHPNGKFLVASSFIAPGRVHILNSSNLSRCSELDICNSSAGVIISVIKFSSCGSFLAAGLSSGNVIVMRVVLLGKASDHGVRLDRVTLCSTPSIYREPIESIDWSENAHYLRATGKSHHLITWDRSGVTQVETQHTRNLEWKTCTCFGGWDTSGTRETVLAEDRLDAENKECVAETMKHSMYSVVASSNDNPVHQGLLVVGTVHGTIKLHHLPCTRNRTGSKDFYIHKNPISSVSFVANGRYLVSSAVDESSFVQWSVVQSFRTKQSDKVGEHEAVNNGNHEDNLLNNNELDYDSDIDDELCKFATTEHHFKSTNQSKDNSQLQAMKTQVTLDTAKLQDIPAALFRMAGGLDLPQGIETCDLEMVIGSTCGNMRRGVKVVNGSQIVYPAETLCVIQSTTGTRYSKGSQHHVDVGLNSHQDFLDCDDEITCLDTLHGPGGDLLVVGTSSWDTGVSKLVVCDPRTLLIKARILCPWDGGIAKVQFSPQGSTVLVVGTDFDRTIALFNWSTGSLIAKTSKNDIQPVLSIHWLSEKAFMTGGTHQVLFWSCVGTQLEFTVGDHVTRDHETTQCAPGALCFGLLSSSDILSSLHDTETSTRSYVVSGCCDGALAVWDTIEMKKVAVLRDAHVGPVLTLTSDAVLGIVITGGKNGVLNAWYMEELARFQAISSKVHTLEVQPVQILPISVSQDGDNASSETSSVLSIDIVKSSILNRIEVVVATKANQILVADIMMDRDHVIKPAENTVRVLVYGKQDEVVNSVSGHPTEPIGFQTSTTALQVWDLVNRTQVCEREIGDGALAVVCSRKGDQVAVGTESGKVLVFQLDIVGSGDNWNDHTTSRTSLGQFTVSETPTVVLDLGKHTDGSPFVVQQIKFSTSDEFCAITCEDGPVFVYENWIEIAKLASDSQLNQVIGVDWSETQLDQETSNRQYLRTIDTTGRVVHWNVTAGVELVNPLLVRKYWATCEAGPVATSLGLPQATSKSSATIAVPTSSGKGLALLTDSTVALTSCNGLVSNHDLGTSNAERFSLGYIGLSFATNDRYVLHTNGSPVTRLWKCPTRVASFAVALENWSALDNAEREHARMEYKRRTIGVNSNEEMENVEPTRSQVRKLEPGMKQAFESCFSPNSLATIPTPMQSSPHWMFGFRSTGGRVSVSQRCNNIIYPADQYIVRQSMSTAANRRLSSQQKYYTGHHGQVLAVHICRELGVALSTEKSTKAVIHVWEIDTLATLRIIDVSNDISFTHQGITNLALSPDGQAIAATLSDASSTLLLISLEDGSLQKALPTHVGTVSDLVWQNVSGGGNQYSGNQTRVPVALNGPVVAGELGVVFTSMKQNGLARTTISRGTFRHQGDGEVLSALSQAVCCLVAATGTNSLGETFGGLSQLRYKGQNRNQTSGRQVCDQRIVSGHLNGSIAIWDENGSQLPPVVAHEGPVLALSQTNTGNASGFATQFCREIAWESGNQGSISTSSNITVSGGVDGIICFWDKDLNRLGTLNLRNVDVLSSIVDNMPEVRSLSFSEDDSQMCVALSDGTILIGSYETARDKLPRAGIEWTVANSGHAPQYQPFSSTQSGFSSTVQLRKQTSRQVCTAAAPDMADFPGSRHIRGSIVFSAARGSGVRSWDVTSRTMESCFSDTFTSAAIEIVPSQGQLLVGTQRGKLRLLQWDLLPIRSQVLSCAKSEITCIRISPCQNFIAVGSAEGSVHVLSCQQYMLLQVTKAHTSPVTELKWETNSSSVWSTDEQNKEVVVRLNHEITTPSTASAKFLSKGSSEIEVQGSYLVVMDSEP